MNVCVIIKCPILYSKCCSCKQGFLPIWRPWLLLPQYEDLHYSSPCPFFDASFETLTLNIMYLLIYLLIYIFTYLHSYLITHNPHVNLHTHLLAYMPPTYLFAYLSISSLFWTSQLLSWIPIKKCEWWSKKS